MQLIEQLASHLTIKLIAIFTVSPQIFLVKELLSAGKHIKLFQVKSSGIFDVQISFPARTNGINVNRCGQSGKFDFESRRDSRKLTNSNSSNPSSAHIS